MHSSSSQIHDYRKATQSSPYGSRQSPMKLSSVQTTPEFLPKSKELTEALLKPNERELVVEDSSG